MLWYRCDVLLALFVWPLASLTMSPCPPGCCCPGPGFLVLCESLGLRSLPRLVPLSTSALSVARNQLCNVDHLLQAFSGLQELSLSHNLLARFPRGLPPSLESLLLQENRITYITSGVLRQLRNLTRLHLEDNRIRAIQPGALLGLKKLQLLTLKGNKLTSLPPSLPPSLTHLDLSENCISSLDLPSLAALVNLQVLQINSNCLRSVPENTFDSLPRLRSVDLTNNLWVCECDILYLYRWLLSGRLKMATDLVCKEPVHLAHHLLLNLSIVSICPRVLKPNEKMHLPVVVSVKAVRTSDPGSYENGDDLQWKRLKEAIVTNEQNLQDARVLPYSFETLTYEECLSFNMSPSATPTDLKTTSFPKDQGCRENTTSPYPQGNVSSAAGTQSGLSTNREETVPPVNPQLYPHSDSKVIVSLLALLCVLLVLVMLAVLTLLRKVLVRQQRVAPANERSVG